MSMVDHSKLSKEIKQYWDERAKRTDPDSKQATTYDVFLRELEIAKLKEKLESASLPEGSTVVDLGCGDGHSTVSIAASFPSIRFVGVDWSEEMLSLAAQRRDKQRELLDRVTFRQGDMRRLGDALNTEKFEVFYTMRSMINLMQSEEQYSTLMQIAEHLKPGGYYFGCENFMQGQNNFNRMREAMGLPEIPVRWHNHFFDEEEYVSRAESHFDSIEFESKGEEPDYFHPIHQTAGRLPPIGDFCPIKLVSMRRKF
jgi:ubiquinone/menaquinone biosynthesis C-methylase UbiE